MVYQNLNENLPMEKEIEKDENIIIKVFQNLKENIMMMVF